MRNLNVRFLLFVLSFLIHSIHGLAQANFRAKMDGVFQNVDKSQVPTKHLKEFGYDFVPMDVFNGILADTNVLDMTAWRLLYGSFLTSHVEKSILAIPILNAVNAFSFKLFFLNCTFKKNK